jgi:hypothetical protein
MYVREDSDEMRTLEQFINLYGTANVLGAIREICLAKAEHVMENWQDDKLANAWFKTANRIDKIIPDVAKLSPL